VSGVGLPDVGKLLLITGVAIAVIGGLFMVGGRLGLGRLPGDIFTRGGGVTIVFPLVTCLVLSVVVTVVLNIILRLH
jgi:hypothetical protein